MLDVECWMLNILLACPAYDLCAVKNKPNSMRRDCFSWALVVLLPVLCPTANAQPPLISYQPVITGLSAPLDIVNAGDGSNRLYVVQQGGLIRVWNGSTLSNFMNLGSGGANI